MVPSRTPEKETVDKQAEIGVAALQGDPVELVGQQAIGKQLCRRHASAALSKPGEQNPVREIGIDLAILESSQSIGMRRERHDLGRVAAVLYRALQHCFRRRSAANTNPAFCERSQLE